MRLRQLRVDCRGSFDPAAGHMDVEETHVGAVAESRSDRTIARLLLCAHDEPIILKRKPNA
jgi:hypothetical protein